MYFHDPENIRGQAAQAVTEYLNQLASSASDKLCHDTLMQAAQHAENGHFDKVLSSIQTLPSERLSSLPPAIIEFLIARQNYVESGDYNAEEVRALGKACQNVVTSLK